LAVLLLNLYDGQTREILASATIKNGQKSGIASAVLPNKRTDDNGFGFAVEYNRISSSRLFEFAKVLDVPVSHFFEEMAPGVATGTCFYTPERVRSPRSRLVARSASKPNTSRRLDQRRPKG
jgi:hypothetical protein